MTLNAQAYNIAAPLALARAEKCKAGSELMIAIKRLRYVYERNEYETWLALSMLYAKGELRVFLPRL